MGDQKEDYRKQLFQNLNLQVSESEEEEDKIERVDTMGGKADLASSGIGPQLPIPNPYFY